MLFFFNWRKTSRRFHFFVLELPYMQSKGRTMRMAVHMGGAYEYDEVCQQQSARKTSNDPVFKLKIMVF